MAEILLSKSEYWKKATINAALRGVALNIPRVYVALYLTAPTAADTGQEVSGGGYARQAVTFTAPVLSDDRARVENAAEVAFPIVTADQGLIAHIGIRDAATGGNLLYHGKIKTPRSALVNDIIRLIAGQIKIDEG